MPIKFKINIHNDDDESPPDDSKHLVLSTYRLPVPSLSQHMISVFNTVRSKMDQNSVDSTKQVSLIHSDSGRKDSLQNSQNEVDMKSDIPNPSSESTIEHENAQLELKSVDDSDGSKSNDNSEEIEKVELSKNLNLDSLKKIPISNDEQTKSTDDSDDQHLNNLELTQNTHPQSSVVKIKQSNDNITEIWHFVGTGVQKTTSKESQYFDDKQVDEEVDVVCGDQNEEQVFVPRKNSLNEFKDFEINNNYYCSSQEAPFLDHSSSDMPLKQNEECHEETTEKESCSLLDHREYYYVSSDDESDIEVIIKIPKLAFADSVLEELSSACPSYKLVGISRRNKDEKDNAEQNMSKLESTEIQHKEVPKPYTNIFPNKTQPEICEIFLNGKLQNQPPEEGEKVKEEEDSIEHKMTQQTFIVTNQEEMKGEKLSTKFSTLHKNFDPSRITTKRSASTLTDPIGKDWEFWKAFINNSSTSAADSTQTKTKTFPNYNEFLLSTVSAKSDSQLDVGTEPYSEIQLSPDSNSTKIARTLSSVSSWRIFTLSSGYSHQKLSNVVGNVTVSVQDDSQPPIQYAGKYFDKLDKIGGGGTRSEQKLLKKSDPKSELCTSDTSISSASEIPKGRKHSRKHAQLKANFGKTSSKFNQKQFMMPTEGAAMPNVEEVKESINFEEADHKAHKGYSNSSSSCFSLPDEAETDNYDVEGKNMKEGVFPFIKAPDDELGLNNHFGGDEPVTSTVETVDSTSVEEERSSNFSDDDDDGDDENADFNVFTNTPSSGKSSKGSVYSVGASLPPIPSSTVHSQKSVRSSQSRSPRMGRLALQSQSGQRLVLNKVKPSSRSSVSGKIVSEETLKLVKTETSLRFTKRSSSSDDREPHDCDSIHGLLMSADDLNGNKIASPKMDDRKTKVSTTPKKSYEETYSRTNRNRLPERGEDKRASRQSSSRVRHWMSSMFRWCDVRHTSQLSRQTKRRNTIK